LGLVNVIPILGWIISIIGVFVLIYMNIMGIINAVNRKEKPLPILGKQYEECLNRYKNKKAIKKLKLLFLITAPSKGAYVELKGKQ